MTPYKKGVAPTPEQVLGLVTGLTEADGSAQLKLRLIHQLLIQYFGDKPLQDFSRLLREPVR